MNAFCHVTQAWAAWELRSKSITKPTRRSYAEVLLESLEKSLQEAAAAHAEIIAQQKLWTTWYRSR
jgi:hypothetical protein